MAFLEVRGLTRRFGRVMALDHVSFTLEAGQWLAVLGPSGSGKSTLLHCLAQLQSADEGSIVLEGWGEVAHLDAGGRARLRREGIGIVFQQFHLLPYLTALENVMLAQWFHSMADRSEAMAALDRVGLGHRTGHLPRELSGGEQQRVCIARALINNPKLLLADEPTGALDEASQANVLDLFGELHREGHAIVTVTHDATVAHRADSELVLEHGRVAASVAGAHDAAGEADLALARVFAEEEAGTAVSLETIARGLARRVLDACLAQGFLSRSGDDVALTLTGRERARDVVRRQRLGERLMQQALRDDGGGPARGTCSGDHVIAAVEADRTCAFLGHPRSCPHDRPIPPGPCCAASRADWSEARAAPR